MFAFEHYKVVPDILLLGKALGAGMPIGAVVSSKKMMDAFSHHPILGHITTFGGHPLVAAAALAGINELLDSKLISEVPNKEMLFRKLLQHSAIQKIDGMGLMLAVQLDTFENTVKVIEIALQEGLISDWFLFASNKIRIAPPLTITYDEISMACQILLGAIEKVYGVSV